MVDLKTIKAISHDEWKALGPLYQPAEPEGDNYYDGTRREAPTTPKWASLSVGGPKKLLGNPSHSSKRDDFTNAHSQWLHFAKILQEGGEDALKTVREAAKEADKMASISEHMHSSPTAWVARAGDAQTGLVIREFMDMVAEFYPPSKGVVRQTLPTKAEDLPTDEMLKKLDAMRPKRFRKRVLEDGRVRYTDPDKVEASQDREFQKSIKARTNTKFKTGPKHYSGMVAVYADEGMATEAAAYVAKLDKRLLAAPERNKELWDALGAVREPGVYFPQVYSPESKQGKAADELLARADVAVFFTSHAGSRLESIIAEASRQGKASKVFDANGIEEEELLPLLRSAEAAHMSKKEFVQSKSHHAFEMSASEPWAYYGLSLIRDEKKGSLSAQDISKLSDMGESINAIADMAETKAGAEFLVGAHRDPKSPRLSASAVALLADKDVMAAARQSLLEVRRETEAAGEEIIGPKHYPEGLIMSGNIPAYLFIKGDKDFFKNAGNIIGVTGAEARDESERRLLAAQQTRAISTLTMQPVTLAYVQGQTAIDIPETGPQIMFAIAGTAHTSKEVLEKEARVVENGGVVVRAQPPVNRAYVYNAKAFNKETGKKGALVPVAATGDSTFERKMAGLLGSTATALVVTDLNARQADTHQHVAMVQALKAGRVPAVLDFRHYDGIDHVSGNRVVHGNTGAKALTKAGFGNRDVEELGPKFADQYVAMNVGSNPALGMVNLARHVSGKAIELPEKATERAKQNAEQEL